MSKFSNTSPATNKEISQGSMTLRARCYADRAIVVGHQTGEMAKLTVAGVRYQPKNKEESVARKLDKIADSDCKFNLLYWNITPCIMTQEYLGDYLCP